MELRVGHLPTVHRIQVQILATKMKKKKLLRLHAVMAHLQSQLGRKQRLKDLLLRATLGKKHKTLTESKGPSNVVYSCNPRH
jgi:hypothetical protein